MAKLAPLPSIFEDAFTGFANAGFDDPEDGLVIRLIDWLVATFLARSHDRIHAVCLLLGLIEYVETQAEPARMRRATTVAKVHWQRLPILVTNPGQIADDVYDWSTAVDHELLISRLGVVAASFGLVSGFIEQSQEVHDALSRPADERDELRLPIVQAREAGARAEAGLLLSEAPAQGAKKKGLAVVPYGRGSASFDIELRPGLIATVGLAGGVQGGLLLTIRPTGIDAEADLFGGGGNAAFSVKLARVATAPDGVVIIAGAPGKTRFEAREVLAESPGPSTPRVRSSVSRVAW